MVKECQFIIDSIGTVSFEEFADNPLLWHSAAMAIAIIGEAARGIPDDFKGQYDHTPWKSIVAMRNILIHEYFNIDLVALYNTCTTDIPKLYRDLKAICKAEGWECE